MAGAAWSSGRGRGGRGRGAINGGGDGRGINRSPEKRMPRDGILGALEEARILSAEETTGYDRQERMNECMKRFHSDFHGDILEEIMTLMRRGFDHVAVSSKDLAHATAVEKLLHAVSSSEIKPELTVEQKTHYFKIFARGWCGDVVPLICDVYQLRDPSLQDHYARIITESLPRYDANELCKWIAPLDIGDLFDPALLVKHCIAANAWTVLEQLVEKYNHVRDVAIKLYDEFLGMSKTARIEAYSGIQPTPWNPMHFTPRLADDRLMNWCKTAGVDFTEHCPGLRKQRAIRVFRYYVDSTFVNAAMSYDAFTDMSEVLAQRVPQVLPAMIDFLDWRGFSYEAAKWAKKYNLGSSLLTDAARRAMKNLTEAELTAKSQATIEKVSAQQPFYEFRLPSSSVRWIDTEEAFCDFMRPLLETATVVGIDGEWVMPEFGQAQAMALMQIATRETVYLIDMVALEEAMAGEPGHLLKALLANPKIQKIGFDLKHDFRILSNLGPHLADASRTAKGVIDLYSLFAHRKRLEKPVYGGQPRISSGVTFTMVLFPGKEAKMPLHKLMLYVLKKPLDKREQESNWERRPLRQAQIEYAALDSFYLLNFFDVLQERVRKSGCPVGEFWASVIQELEKIRLELLASADQRVKNGE